MERLSERLSTVTEADDFATALTLMLRSEFELTVWDWLSGGSPDPVLREHGIERTLDSDSASLEAIGVLSLLFAARRGTKFVLVIDEVERILAGDAAAQGDRATLTSFKRLLEIVTKTGTLMVLCGLPEFLEVIPTDARQRIGTVVRPSKLSAADTVQYIEDISERMFGARSLAPFSTDTARYLTELASGNPRRVVRLSHRAYEIASRPGPEVTDVTRAVIREAARDQFETATDDELKREIVRVLDRNGWRFETDVRMGSGKRKRHVDYWVPSGQDEREGCAVILTPSILQEGDSKTITADTQALRQAKSDGTPDVLIVVNGYAVESSVRAIEKAGGRILIYDGKLI